MDFLDLEQARHQRELSRPPTYETGVVITTPLGKATPTANQRWVNATGGSELLPISEDAWQTAVGDTVCILRGPTSGGVVVGAVAGLARRLPGSGVVTVVPGGSETVTVAKNSVNYTVRFLNSYVPQVNDVVALAWHPNEGGYIVGEYGATSLPIPPPPPPAVVNPAPPPQPPPAPPVTGQNGFWALDARSWRNGAWRTDSGVVAQADFGGFGTNNGAWFYGSEPTAYLAGKIITRARIRIHRRSGGAYSAQNLHLYLHTSRTRPAGDVTRTAGPVDFALDIGQQEYIDIPAAWGQTIVDTGGGIAITGTPYVVCYGIANPDAEPESGILHLDWRTT